MSLSGCAPSAPVPVDAAFDFDRYEVVTGYSHSQTVLAGFLTGNTVADMAVVDVGKDGHRRLRIYAFDGESWSINNDTGLDESVIFIDLARIAGRDRLVLFERGQVSWFDPGSEVMHELARFGASFDKADAPWAGFDADEWGAVPVVDAFHDLNDDGLDDMVMPELDGFWVAIQNSDGSFPEPMKLGPPEPFLNHARDGVSYREAGITELTIPFYMDRLHQVDYDQDGRSDLVFWNEDHFEVYLQGEQGRFAPEARSFTTGIPFDSDGAYSLIFEFAEQGAIAFLLGSGEKSRKTILYSLTDVNGDGVADLVTQTLEGRSVRRQRSSFRVYQGHGDGDGIRFTTDIGPEFRPQSMALGMQPWGYSAQRLEDLDGDGLPEFMFGEVTTNLAGMFRAMAGNSVPLNLEVYRNEGGNWFPEPAVKYRIRRFAPFDGIGNVFLPAVLLGDVNGDGLQDLVVGHSPRELHLYAGAPGPGLFARRPQPVSANLPHDERNSRLVDLNRDGRQDLLMHLKPTNRSQGEPHRLAILVSR